MNEYVKGIRVMPRKICIGLIWLISEITSVNFFLGVGAKKLLVILITDNNNNNNNHTDLNDILVNKYFNVSLFFFFNQKCIKTMI